MFGNIINNRQLAHLVEVDKAITFRPFDKNKLKLAHYPLHAAGILWPGPINAKGAREYTFRRDFATKDDYTFEAGEYAIVEVEEWIVLPEGIVGHFLPSSSLVERGFGLTAGKLDPQYGSLGGEPKDTLRSQEFNE